MSYSRPPPDVDDMTSVKVDNLTYRTSPETLRVVFEKYGRVGDVYIPRDSHTKKSQGFAFVRFHDKRDAEDAIYAMDGAVLDGRELRVQLARVDMERQTGQYIDDMTSVKVDNLTYRTSPETLRQVFEKYGRVGDVYIPKGGHAKKSQGFAFVRFHDKRDAEDAIYGMDGAVLDGRELRVQMAHGGGGGRRRGGQARRYGGHSHRSRRHESFTPNSSSGVSSMAEWDFPNGEAAGPSRLAWNEGETFQFPDHLSHTPKRRKQMVPIGDEDEGADRLHGADITTAQTSSTLVLKSLVVLEVENDMLREENEKLKRELEKQKQTFFLQSDFLQS